MKKMLSWKPRDLINCLVSTILSGDGDGCLQICSLVPDLWIALISSVIQIGLVLRAVSPVQKITKPIRAFVGGTKTVDVIFRWARAKKKMERWPQKMGTTVDEINGASQGVVSQITEITTLKLSHLICQHDKSKVKCSEQPVQVLLCQLKRTACVQNQQERGPTRTISTKLKKNEHRHYEQFLTFSCDLTSFQVKSPVE